MKKLLHFFALSFLLISCSKEAVNHQETSNVKEPAITVQNMTDRVVDVYERMHQDPNEPNYREGVMDLTVEEGVWGIEALMNIYFSEANITVDNISISEVVFTVPIVDNKISNADLTNAYMIAWQDLLDNYNSRNWANKQTIYVDLSIESVTSNEAQIKAVSVVGNVSEETNLTTSPDCDDVDPVFVEGEDWLAGYAAGEGKCDETMPGSNAAEELEKKLNYFYPLAHPIVSPYPNAVYHVGFFDIETIWEIDPIIYEYLNETDDTPWDNERDYLMYVTTSGYPNFFTPDCLDHDDMNWYYCKMWGIIENLIPLGREFINVDVEAGAYFTGGTTRVHRMDLSHGIPLFISDIGWGPASGPFIEAIDLTERILDIP